MVVFCFFIIIIACNPFAKTKYSNCVVAKDEINFVGEWLKHDGNVEQTRLLTTDCENMDKKIDGGDGKNKGKVRWAACLQGPDCDEAGMF